MKQTAANAIQRLLNLFGLAISSRSTLETFKQHRFARQHLNLLMALNGRNAETLISFLDRSKAQLKQDLFVLSHLSFKTSGYFVEFGAADGLSLSNTHLLEKEFGWKGILAEPAKSWHPHLKRNRRCSIEERCVWSDSTSRLEFREAECTELSTINRLKDSDQHFFARKSGVTYNVDTISLIDLLRKHGAPKVIDYLSIDTEGSELDILSAFDFSQYSFQVITCEHNYTSAREKINALLRANGYERVLQEVSLFDDWYVKFE